MSSGMVGEEPAASVRTEWEHHDDNCSTLRFAAVEMRLRTLTLAIIGTILTGAPFGIPLTIALADGITSMSPRAAIFIAGTLVGFPLYVLLMLILYRHTKACAITFRASELSVELGDVRHAFSYRGLTMLRWVCDSEYARIVIRGEDGASLSVITGIARVPKNCSPELPPLPLQVVQRLEEAGLTAKNGRRPGMTSFLREPLRG